MAKKSKPTCDDHGHKAGERQPLSVELRHANAKQPVSAARLCGEPRNRPSAKVVATADFGRRLVAVLAALTSDPPSKRPLRHSRSKSEVGWREAQREESCDDRNPTSGDRDRRGGWHRQGDDAGPAGGWGAGAPGGSRAWGARR